VIKTHYVDFLRNERGLTERSIYVYSPFIQEFLTEWVDRTGSGSPEAWDAQFVDEFLLHHARDRSSEYTRLLATTLRSFLRFLYLRGETATDLSPAVPMVRRWRETTVPAFLSPEEVERTLSATDPSTACGRRDHAILLLLARLGLRAGEVVALELGDIRWRTAQLCVRGKGRVLDQLPLLSEVGEALALYLQMDRGESASRRVFLRIIAPRVGLSGPGVVSHIVRWAFAQAGVHPTSRGAAHLFRHSLATRMLRQGASMAEISELLRHRSRATTSIYAKVDFEALRGVAGSWPGTGGVR
jgi:site-specific recombinase XerD